MWHLLCNNFNRIYHSHTECIMKKGILRKKSWVFLDTVDAYEKFLDDLDAEWEIKGGTKENTFNDWVNHYYRHLLKDLGPSNSQLFS